MCFKLNKMINKILKWIVDDYHSVTIENVRQYLLCFFFLLLLMFILGYQVSTFFTIKNHTRKQFYENRK